MQLLNSEAITQNYAFEIKCTSIPGIFLSLMQKRRKGWKNDEEEKCQCFYQCRDHHKNVYFGDQCLNEKAAPQRAVSFLHTEIVVGIDSILHSDLLLT